MESKSPSFQFYPSDYLDKKVMRMSYEAQGVYVRILCHMWNDSDDQCSIENDLKMIARILGVTRKKIEKIFKEILWDNDPIFISENGRLVSKRLRKEKEKQVLSREKRQNAASKRWKQSTCNADAKQCLSFSSSTSTTKKKEKEKEKKEKEKEKDALPKKDFKNQTKKNKRSTNVVPIETRRRIIDHLNGLLGTAYKSESRKTTELITARFNEGFTEEDFFTVHEKKFQEWRNTEFSTFLRPETLYGPKFESYLNQKTKQRIQW